MNKRNFKLFAVPAIYIAAIMVFGTSMFLIQRVVNNNHFEDEVPMEYVDSEIVTDNEYIPVVNINPTIMRPYLNDLVALNKSFYNIDDDKNNQQNAIIYYENTYIQNTGADYKLNEVFDVISVLDGTVVDITDNEILGHTIKIRHNNELISTYQCLGDLSVKKDDSILRGQVIAKSGTCKLYSNDFNLHFELSYQGKNINPETSYNKTDGEL